MPFRLVTGAMGGGKSYLGAEIALKCWSEGGVVHSNMDWDWDELEARGFDRLHVKLPEDPTAWREVLIGGAEGQENLLLVDESAMIFHTWDASESRKRDRELFDALVMSRKLGLDVYFITQHADNVQSALRRMANEDLRCVAVAKVPIIGPWLRWMKGDFLRIVRQPEKRVELSRSYHRFRPEVGKLYKTEALRGAAANIVRDPTRQRQKLKAPLWLRVTFVLMCIAFGLSVKRLWDYAHEESYFERKAREKTPGDATAHPSTRQAQEPPQPKKSPKMGDLVSGTARDLVGPATGGPPSPPLLHPYGPASGATRSWFEWAPEDERIILAQQILATGGRVQTMGGQIWHVGAVLEGGCVETMVYYGREWYVTLDTGRTFYLRMRTYQERRDYDEYLVRLAAYYRAQTQFQPTSTQWTSPSSAPPTSLP